MRTPKRARQIHPRLDRHHVAGIERLLGALGEARRLVDLEPHPVPQPVAELVAVAGRHDRVARRRRRPRVPGRPGADRVEGADLGGAHELVDLARLVVQLAGGDGAGAVRAVAVDDRPHVDEQELVLCTSRSEESWCGRALFSPAATMAGNDGSSAPSSRMRCWAASMISRSVRPTTPALVDPFVDLVGDPCRLAIASSS